MALSHSTASAPVYRRYRDRHDAGATRRVASVRQPAVKAGPVAASVRVAVAAAMESGARLLLPDGSSVPYLPHPLDQMARMVRADKRAFAAKVAEAQRDTFIRWAIAALCAETLVVTCTILAAMLSARL